MLNRSISGLSFVLALTTSFWAAAQTIPDQPPDIRVDDLFSDRFTQGPLDLYPRIEFISDRNAYFSSTGESHSVAVRVYDENGNIVSDPSLDWVSEAPSLLDVEAQSGGALLESLGDWQGAREYTVSAPGLGVSAKGQAIMADIQPEVVQVPSHWVRSIMGDRAADHQVVLESNSVTDAINPGDIVLSGDYAGVMVRALTVSTDQNGNVAIAAEPAPMNEVFENYQQQTSGEPLLVRVESNRQQTRYTIRSLRDDVVLYSRTDTARSVRSLLECSGNLEVGQNVDVDFMNLEWQITPHADIDLTAGSVELFEVGVEGMVSVEAQASVNLSAGVSLSGQCGPNLPDINLPGVFVYGIDIRPTIFPEAYVSVSASAEASAGWVPLSGLERTWTIGAGIRYTGAQGWAPYSDYNAFGSEPAATGLDVQAALTLELAAQAQLAAGLSFCAGTCTLFPSLVDASFLEMAGGPYWRLQVPTPIAVDHPGYLGPDLSLGVQAGASAGVSASFFDSGIFQYIPISGGFDLMVPVFEEDWPYFEAEVTGSIDCNPTCSQIPDTGGTIDMVLQMDTDSSGTATFWLEQPGAQELVQIASAPFSGGQASTSQPTGSLPQGEYRVHGRLQPDGAAYWFASQLPLAPADRIGVFTVSEGDVNPPPEPGDTFQDCPDCPTMVIMPVGTFTQGSPPSEPERDSNEGPQRSVNVPAFAMSQTEVTFDEWDACVASGGCTQNPGDPGWGRGERPVVDVSWNDAQEYVAWLSAETGEDYRLPSESEWEYATRAGTTGRFNTGDCITTDQANFRGTNPAQGCPTGVYLEQTLPVASFAPNAFGLYDTHGNVWEWTQDCWNSSYTGAPPDGSAWMTGDCSGAVLRGGGWYSEGRDVRSAVRIWLPRDYRDVLLIGFRVARSATL